MDSEEKEDEIEGNIIMRVKRPTKTAAKFYAMAALGRIESYARYLCLKEKTEREMGGLPKFMSFFDFSEFFISQMPHKLFEVRNCEMTLVANLVDKFFDINFYNVASDIVVAHDYFSSLNAKDLDPEFISFLESIIELHDSLVSQGLMFRMDGASEAMEILVRINPLSECKAKEGMSAALAK